MMTVSHKSSTLETTRRWSSALEAFLPGFFDNHEVLKDYYHRSSLILHGSTTMGIDDVHSDLDIYFLMAQDELSELDRRCGTRFFSFQVDGKKGHLNACATESVTKKLAGCDMDLIYQMRRSVLLTDHKNFAQSLQNVANRPMSAEVMKAWFFYHYVEMRGEHRSCDNPIERGNGGALFFALAKTLTHALHAAMVLDGEPYPYDKWLFWAAKTTATGGQVAAVAERILTLLSHDVLRQRGSQTEHPINQELMIIRRLLIGAAQAKGIHDEWLDRWWHYMDAAQEAIRSVRWTD